jgi:hypothetical protein
MSKKKYTAYEVGKPVLQFSCRFAVYPANQDQSICYCTDQARAEMVAEALTRFVETPAFERLFERLLKRQRVKRNKPVSLKEFPQLVTRFPKGRNKKDRAGKGQG